MNNSAGFTLAELVVTIVLVGILAASAIPTFNNVVVSVFASSPSFLDALAKFQRSNWILYCRHGSSQNLVSFALRDVVSSTFL